MLSLKWPRKFFTFEPHKSSKETYLAYTRADDSSPARQARLVPASAGDNKNNPTLMVIIIVKSRPDSQVNFIAHNVTSQ